MLELLAEHLASLRKVFDEQHGSLEPIKDFLRDPAKTSCPTDLLELPARIPVFLQDLTAFVRSEENDQRLRALAGSVFGYVFNPLDLIDDEEFGYLGFIDDALNVYYSMRRIEQEHGTEAFPSLRDPKLAPAVAAWEGLLKQDLVVSLKSYIDQVTAIFRTADFSVVDDGAAGRE